MVVFINIILEQILPAVAAKTTCQMAFQPQLVSLFGLKVKR